MEVETPVDITPGGLPAKVPLPPEFELRLISSFLGWVLIIFFWFIKCDIGFKLLFLVSLLALRVFVHMFWELVMGISELEGL